MKPRYEEVSYETTLMLEKAKIMNDRLNTLEKAKCDCGEEPCKHRKKFWGFAKKLEICKKCCWVLNCSLGGDPRNLLSRARLPQNARRRPPAFWAPAARSTVRSDFHYKISSDFDEKRD